MCILTSLLFLGGYNINNDLFTLPLNYLNNFFIQDITIRQEYLSITILKGLTDGTILAIKSCILIFTFIWIRASFPRIRYDQLMSFCWTILLPIVIAIIILVPCIIYSLDFMRIK
jgi:NADH-ubiquinone oxidoreductase chain 1